MRSIHSCGASLRMLAVIGIATFGMVGTVIAATFNENIFVNGSLGIGTATPLSKLDVSGNARFHAQNDAGNTLLIENQARTRAIGIQTAGGDRIATNLYHNGDGQGGSYSWSGTASALNLTNGNTGIGTIDPLARLHVSGGELLVSNGANGGVVRLHDGSSSNPNSVYFKNVGMGDLRIIDGNEDVNMSVTHDGRVGIGAVDPQAKLQVQGSAVNDAKLLVRGTPGINPSIELGSTEGGASTESGEGFLIRYMNDVGETIFNNIYTRSTQAFRFQSGGSDRLVIQSGGNVGIGTSAPLSTLDVSGHARFHAQNDAGNTVMIENQARTRAIGIQTAGGDRVVTNLYRNGDGQGGNYNWSGIASALDLTNGNMGIGTDSPNQRLTIKGGGIGFDGNSADKKLYSPVDGVLEWSTHDWATEHGFSVSHQGARRVFLNTNGASYLAGGRLGVGTTDPQAMLHVEGGSARDAKILVRGKGNTNPSLELGAENGTNLESGEGLVIRYMNEIGETIFDNIYNASVNAFRFQSGGSDRFVIQSGGNIGVGVPNPSERLEVSGNIKLSGGIKSDGDICIGMCE